MARDDKYASGTDPDYSASPFKNADSPAVSEESDNEDGPSEPTASSTTEDNSSSEVETEAEPVGDADDSPNGSEAFALVTRGGLPYAMARSKVTDDRQQKQFQLLKETRFELQDAVSELVKQYDDENLSETDALEIILRTGLAHTEDYDAAAKSLGFGLENIQFSFSE